MNTHGRRPERAAPAPVAFLWSESRHHARWLVALGALMLFACATAQQAVGQSGGQGVPKDFQLVLESGANHDGPVFVESIVVDTDGNVALSEFDSPEGIQPAKDIRIEKDAVARIWGAVQENDFFGLKPNYVDESIVGGDFARLTVTAEGKSHSVRTVNIKVKAFDRVAMVVNREMPGDRWVIYNALHIDDYMEVER